MTLCVPVCSFTQNQLNVPTSTPRKTNMEPEKSHMEEEKHLQTMNFQVPCWFSGVYMYVLYIYLMRLCFCKQFGKFIVANYINRVSTSTQGDMFVFCCRFSACHEQHLLTGVLQKKHPIVNPTMLAKDAS